MQRYSEQIIDKYDLNLVCGESRSGEPVKRTELLIRMLETADDWAVAVADYGVKPSRKEIRQRRKDLTKFIKEKTDMGVAPVGFLDSLIWTFLLNRLVAWAVTKILDHIFKDDSQ